MDACSTVASLLHQHLTVTLWFQHCQLLPEVDPALTLDDSNAVPYPAAPLQQIYRNRSVPYPATLLQQIYRNRLLVADMECQYRSYSRLRRMAS